MWMGISLIVLYMGLFFVFPHEVFMATLWAVFLAMIAGMVSFGYLAIRDRVRSLTRKE